MQSLLRISLILCISLISCDALLVFVPARGRSARWIRLLSAGAPLASNREDHEFKKFVKGAKKTVMEKALATVEESQVKEKGDGGQESQVGGATASTTAAAGNTIPSATTNADANPNGNAAAVPAEIDNAIAPSGESTGSNGGLHNESDAALADDDDDGDFPIDNDDDDSFTSTSDQEAQLIANTHARYDFSTANLKHTAPLYKNDLFRLEDENQQPLICDMAFLDRGDVIHFIASMKRKPMRRTLSLR